MSLEYKIFRMMCTKNDKKRDKGRTIPESVEYKRDIRYGRHRKYHTLDICWPKVYDGKPVGELGRDIRLPVIISVHGGAYVYGTKEVYQFYAASLAEQGFAVVNFDYRLAPKDKFPAPLEDLNLVLIWLMKHKDQYPVDLDKVFMVGDSAGAQLASQYGAIYSSREYRQVMGFKKPKINLRGLGLNCGMYDMKEFVAKTSLKGTLGDYVTKHPEDFGDKLDVLKYITKDYPPSYLISAKGDFLLENCEPMAKLLNEKGVKCAYKIYGDEKTGHVFHVDVGNEIGRQANRDQLDFFKGLL